MTQYAHHARLDWSSGQPVSTDYGDVYFSRESGLEETRHVFIANNHLPERFAALPDGSVFTIGETGFGTGLNFLIAWQTFLQHAPAGCRLAFVSTEKHPLAPHDLERALAMWPELADQAQQLLAQYDAMPPGWHRFVLEAGRITLTLLVGDVLTTLPELDACVDAWFLDGFAPSRNPDMWQPALFAQLARLSAPAASFATFTSAGIVRRGMAEAGFEVEKVAGYGSKREMTRGQRLPDARTTGHSPWYDRPRFCGNGEQTAIVIGAGIAGASTAYSLACRGWQVTVVDRHPAPASEASGNPQGVLYTKLSPHFTPLTRLILSGYSYSLHTLKACLPQGEDTWQQCGVLQLAHNDDEARRQAGLAAAGLPEEVLRKVSAEEASQLAGIDVTQGGLYFSQGGWLNPPAWVSRLLDHPNISVRLQTAVTELAQNPDDLSWVAMSSEGPLALGSIVVLATANDTVQFDATFYLPVKRIRGQVSVVPATPASRQLKTVLCGEGYVSPVRHDTHCLGATFKFDTSDTTPTASEHDENLDMLASLSPALFEALGASSLEASHCTGRAALRCTSPDYLPMVGAVVNREAFLDTYQALGRDASVQLSTPSPEIPGLFVSTAHGSRGMVTAPLCGEVLASLLTGEPAPLPKPIMDAIHPSRFLVRDLIRQKHRD